MNKFTINIASRNENLGISVRKYSPEKALIIEDVVHLSPAFLCDLKVGDIILKVNGKSTKYFASKIASQLAHSKKTFAILVKRKNEPMTLRTLRDSYSESSGSNISRATTASNFYACTNPNSTQLFSHDSAPEDENRSSDMPDGMDSPINFNMDTKRKSQNQLPTENLKIAVKKLKSGNNCFLFKKWKSSKSLSNTKMPENDQIVTMDTEDKSVKQKKIIKTKFSKKSKFPILSINKEDNSIHEKEIIQPELSPYPEFPGIAINLNNNPVKKTEIVESSPEQNSKSPVISMKQDNSSIKEKEIIKLRLSQNPEVPAVVINLDNNPVKRKELFKRSLQRNSKFPVSSVNEENYPTQEKKTTNTKIPQNSQTFSQETSIGAEFPETVVAFKIKKSYNSMNPRDSINKTPKDSKVTLKTAATIDSELNSKPKIIIQKPVSINTKMNDKPKITFRRKYNQN